VSARAEELELVVRGSRALGVELAGDRARDLIRYLDLMYTWNVAAGLTTVPRAHAVRLHLLDALAVVPFVFATGKIADLGSGGGLPGIPIAVALPDSTVTLVESRRKKCSFLIEALRSLGLANCGVLERDARDLDDYTAAFDVIVARAFLGPEALLEVASPLLRPGGRVVVMGARKDDALDRIADAEDRFVRVADKAFVLFGGSERRRIVVLEKRFYPAATR
jgi:16S rRNA (guanine527-N7)-methyltransferase